MDRQLWVEIAKLYYIEHMSQEQIAQKLFVSRSSISRVISKCVDEGIVEISINDPMTKLPEVSSRLCKKYALKDVFICSTGTRAERTERAAGELIARHFADLLSPGMRLGVSNGRICYQTARSMKRNLAMKVDVLQLQGGTSEKLALTDGQGLIAAFSGKLGGEAYVMQAPVLVKFRSVKQRLMESEAILRVMKMFEKLDVALVEIGAPQAKLGPQFREPWLTRADATQLKDQMAEACICGYYLDKSGVFCNAGINDRNMSIDLAVLRKVPVVIGAAVGDKMLTAVISVLCAGIINTLVVDENLAYLLDQYSPTEK